MKVAIGCDHAAYQAKEELKVYLAESGHQVIDMGCDSPESTHYPIYAKAVVKALLSGEVERGVLICGTGIGMSVTANKYRHIRAALCHDDFTAEASREHNDANILCMGARVIAVKQMKSMCDYFFCTEFAGGRHQIRIDMIDDEDNGR